MGGPLAVPRKPRRDLVTKKCDKLFTKAMEEKEYEKGANIVLYNVFKNYAMTGILNALDNANSFLIRKKMWRGFI